MMVYPEIDDPMYAPLTDLSSEYFLPNIQLLEMNSITLLETNQKFIEAYMVGLNHEFARELLWREYPTDQRGSYFRQFWDVSSFLGSPGADAGRRCASGCFDVPRAAPLVEATPGSTTTTTARRRATRRRSSCSRSAASC